MTHMTFSKECFKQALFRPYQSTWLCKGKDLNGSSYLMPRFFPN